MKSILALDSGTTSARAIVFGHDGSIRAIAQKEFTQQYPKPGWVEHDPLEIWTAQISVAVEALGKAGLRPQDIAHAVKAVLEMDDRGFTPELTIFATNPKD